MAKVYVVTSAVAFEPEVYETVKPSFKEAEKYIRKSFPNAREDAKFGNVVSFMCKRDGKNLIMFIHEEAIA